MQTDNSLVATSKAPPSAEASSFEPRILYCLDFDGVLCDSVHETFLSGWKACRLLWNGENKVRENAWMDSLERDPQKMKQLEDDFRFVRPILYVGWESILLIRLLAGAYTEEIAGTSLDVDDPRSTKDAVFRGFHSSSSSSEGDFRDHALQNWSFSVSDYGNAMTKARYTWIRDDEGSWIGAHGVYEGACRAVENYLETKGNADIYVITTKAKDFALRLLEKQNLFQSNASENTNNKIQESHVFGLGSGPKANVLQCILQARSESSTHFQFFAVMVEDNIATLDKISGSPVGDKVLPVVASWGYNSVEQLSRVLQTPVNSVTSRPYVVLPLLLEPSKLSESEAEKFAETAKQRDPTGCSLASMLQSPSEARKFLSLEPNVMEENLYDISST